MKRTIHVGVYMCVIVMAYIIPLSVEAGIEGFTAYARQDNVLLGHWQPAQSSGGDGWFVEIEDFTPGNILAAKIFLEQPGESVSLTFLIEQEGISGPQFKKTFQDGGPDDLLPQATGVLAVKLTEIPSATVYRYIVRVDDFSGEPPVVTFLESPVDASSFSEKFRKTVSDTAELLWKLPSRLLETERGITGLALRTLVLADRDGNVLKEVSPFESGSLHSPIWLSNEQILFVHQEETLSTLHVLPVTFDGPPQPFGKTLIEGTNPHVTPDRQAVIFRQGTTIFHSNLSGTTITPLIQEKEVVPVFNRAAKEDWPGILGVLPDEEPERYSILFSAMNQEGGYPELWVATVRKTEVLSYKLLPYNSHWFGLCQFHFSGQDMLYEQEDITLSEGRAWNIYLRQLSEQEGTAISSDQYNDRHPSWSPDGATILFVSDRS